MRFYAGSNEGSANTVFLVLGQTRVAPACAADNALGAAGAAWHVKDAQLSAAPQSDIIYIQYHSYAWLREAMHRVKRVVIPRRLLASDAGRQRSKTGVYSIMDLPLPIEPELNTQNGAPRIGERCGAARRRGSRRRAQSSAHPQCLVGPGQRRRCEIARRQLDNMNDGRHKTCHQRNVAKLANGHRISWLKQQPVMTFTCTPIGQDAHEGRPGVP